MARISNAVGTKAIRVEVFPRVKIMKRAPLATDTNYSNGQLWIYQHDAGTDDVYILAAKRAGAANWLNMGGGEGHFDDLVVAATGTIGTTLTVGGAMTLSTLVAGTMRTSAAGVVSSLADGDDGEFLIGTTGGLPVWAELIGGGGINIGIVGNQVTITNPGATGTTSGTDVGGPVAPTGGGLTTFEGYDLNIQTDGATANTVRIRLADTITSVAGIVATTGLTMNAGTCTITSDTNAADAIYLHADGGVGETINIRADQGTSNGSVTVQSDVGGVLIGGGRAAIDAITLNAFGLGSGITVNYSTAGIAFAGANGGFTVASGTADVSIGADAVGHDCIFGSLTGAATTTIQSGTGDLILTSTGDVDIASAGLLELNSTGGIIGIGNDGDAFNINIATGAAQRILTLGNVTGASSTVINVGTGNLDLGVSATAHITRLGSTNTTCATTVQTGTGAMTFTAGGIFDVNAVGAATIDSTGGAISIGDGADAFPVNVATGAAQRLLTLGNITGVSSTIINVGTGNLDLGVSATAHTTRLGSTNTTCDTIIQSGTGAMTLTAGGILDINGTGDMTVDITAGIYDLSTTGDITIDSSAGTIGMGVDDIDQNINIGINGERVVTIGNQVGAAGIVVESGTAGMALNGLGLTSIEVLTDTQAAAAVTVNGNNGAGIFTGLTTASAATQRYTITNNICTVNSRVLVSVENKSAGNDCKITKEAHTCGAGSFTVDTKNNGTQALDSDVVITFFIMTA